MSGHVQYERYAEESHGVFPTFVLAAILIGVIYFVPELILGYNALPDPAWQSAISWFRAVMIPFGVFALFYLAARVRVNLGRDFARISLSILLGSVLSIAVLSFPEYVFISGGNVAYSYQSDPLTTLSAWAGNSVFDAVGYTFIGFSAVLLSYYRRL